MNPEQRIILGDQLIALQMELHQLENEVDAYQKSLACRINGLRERILKLPEEMEKYDREFEAITKLRGKDIGVLLFASILQVVRSIVIGHFKKRLSDQEAAKKTPGHEEEHSSRMGVPYYASVEEIKANPVPFDCICKEDNLQGDSNLKLSGLNHRFKTLGHDPYLGWIFGTLNIMTNTISVTAGRFALSTYHVHTGTRIVQEKVQNIDKICERASSIMMFEKVYERFAKDRNEAFQALKAAVWKEGVHLLSDIRTAKSLPIPFVSLISPDAAHFMQISGLDYWQVKMFEMEAFFANLINWIIECIHSFCYDEKIDGPIELYQVRTKKIVGISNEIATASSILNTLVRVYLGVTKAGKLDAIRQFDYGGSVVTIWHVLNDPIIIAKIKHDYILQQELIWIKNS